MMKRSLSLLIAVLTVSICFAQLGGQSSYQFTTLPNSARVAALGGAFISVADDDLNLAYANPALLDSTDARQLAMNYNSLFADAANGFVTYGHHRSDLDMTFAATMQYLSYGEFTETDEFNQDLGTFTAGEYLLNLAAGRQLDSMFSLGANLKFLSSNLGNYTSSAIAADLGAHYTSKNRDFTMGLVARNMGTRLSSYTEGSTESLPFGIDLGMSKRLRNSPLRLTLTFQDLQTWDLSYTDPAQQGQIDPLTGEVIQIEDPTVADKILLHTNAGMEFMLGKNFHMRLGYDYRRRQELALNDRPGMAGISWGLGMKISKLYLSYGKARYNQAGATNHLSVTLKFKDFNKSS